MRFPFLWRALALAFSFTALVHALPSQANTNDGVSAEPAHSLDKRQTYPNTLWRAEGPVRTDIRQKEVLNCWWRAAQAAIVDISPQWIQHLFVDPFNNNQTYTSTGNPQPQADFPLVQLWNPYTLQPAFYPATIHARSPTEDKADKQGVWWADAVSQAFLEMGKTVDILGYDKRFGNFSQMGAGTEQPLTILTGQPGDSRLVKDYANATQLFTHFQYCNVTPIMFNINETKHVDTEFQFGEDHVYPVIGVSWDASGQQWVNTRNVWGRDEPFKLEDVWDIALRVYFLRDWNRLEVPDEAARRRSLGEGVEDPDIDRRHHQGDDDHIQSRRSDVPQHI